MKSLKSFIESNAILVADGAMATALYERGFYINRSFEELSMSEPNAVREVIRAFKRAGANLIHTNTFNATRPKLTKYGLQDQLKNIVSHAAKLALEELAGKGYVMGLLGPLGVLVEPLGPTSLSEAEEMFFEIAECLEKAGVDGFSINALHDFNELECAIRAVRRASKKPLFVNIGLHENLKTSYGHTIAQFVELSKKHNIDVIGFCGEIGPSPMLTALEALAPLTDKPIMILPNAGLPRYVNDQYIYLCNPDYIGKFAKRYIQAGAQIVGGHSGVYESHIKAISNSVKMIAPATSRESSRDSNREASKDGLTFREKSKDEFTFREQNLPDAISPISDEATQPVSLAARSELGKALSIKEKIFSVELVPPSLADFKKFESRCEELASNGIRFVNIPDGARAMARISSLQLSSHIQTKYSLEAIPHFTCRDRNLIGLQSDLLGAHISGTRNLLLVTGDPPKLGNNPGATAVYDVDSIGLTHIVSRLNRGLDIGGSSTKEQSSFVIGVALNPTAKNSELEIQRFKYKIEAGCDFAITQPIYNVQSYLRFVEQMKADTPIIMGIWPLISLRNAEFLKYEVPGVDVPDWIIEEMKKAGDSKEKAIEIGLEIAIRTMKEAAPYVAGFQVSAPFNRADIAIKVIRSL
jgi:homocysteine S-methyltransferase